MEKFWQDIPFKQIRVKSRNKMENKKIMTRKAVMEVNAVMVIENDEVLASTF